MTEIINVEQLWLQGYLSGLITLNWQPEIFSQMTILDDPDPDESSAADIVLETILGRRFLISISEMEGPHGY